jgi:hypothetical protein
MAFVAAVELLLMSSMLLNAFISIFPLSSGIEKSHGGLDLVNREGVAAQYLFTS